MLLSSEYAAPQEIDLGWLFREGVRPDRFPPAPYQGIDGEARPSRAGEFYSCRHPGKTGFLNNKGNTHEKAVCIYGPAAGLRLWDD